MSVSKDRLPPKPHAFLPILSSVSIKGKRRARVERFGGEGCASMRRIDAMDWKSAAKAEVPSRSHCGNAGV
ncbi:MAG: hypothetical protein LBL45_05380 [Treponema sp.]|nr:hypothetical protein [Treponema sp.]